MNLLDEYMFINEFNKYGIKNVGAIEFHKLQNPIHELSTEEFLDYFDSIFINYDNYFFVSSKEKILQLLNIIKSNNLNTNESYYIQFKNNITQYIQDKFNELKNTIENDEKYDMLIIKDIIISKYVEILHKFNEYEEVKILKNKNIKNKNIIHKSEEKIINETKENTINKSEKKLIKKSNKSEKKTINDSEELINDSEDKSIKKIKEKNKKKSIPLTLKRNVWNKYIGESIGKSLCLCCKLTEITQLNFSCGHIISEFNGGELKLNNLKPICGSCNSSMGSKNMNDFINEFGL